MKREREQRTVAKIFAVLLLRSLLGTGSEAAERKIVGGMEWWDTMTFPIRRVWSGVATHLGIRKSGLLKLRHDVKACEYEDVHVMWEMLKRNETEQCPEKIKKRAFWNFLEWARCTPYLCRSF